jgi:hypothetical protein
MAFLTRARQAALAAAAAVALLPASGRAEQRTTTAEDAIKATFLFNFTKFVEWPPIDSAEPFRICVAAEPAFADALDRIIGGETTQGRPMTRVLLAAPDAARGCQILFIGRGESEHLDRWFAAVKGAPVLLVGESRAFWDHGGHINFVLDENHVRFDVNQDTASRAGLTITSKLLRVARSVTPRRID